jgi:hypothetical protein
MSRDASSVAQLEAGVGNAEAAASLPKGWTWATLGEILPLEMERPCPNVLETRPEMLSFTAQVDG